MQVAAAGFPLPLLQDTGNDVTPALHHPGRSASRWVRRRQPQHVRPLEEEFPLKMVKEKKMDSSFFVPCFWVLRSVIRNMYLAAGARELREREREVSERLGCWGTCVPTQTRPWVCVVTCDLSFPVMLVTLVKLARRVHSVWQRCFLEWKKEREREEMEGGKESK